MKTFSDDALAALERGDAIVSASVEIIPSSSVSYSTVGIYDIDAVSNAAHNATDGLSNGIEVAGFDPSDIVRVSLPLGQTYVAFSVWGVPSPANAPGNTGSQHWLNVIPGGVVADMFYVTDTDTYDGYEAARASFGVHTFTGASSYILYIQDNPIGDNTGGLSVRVEKGVFVAATGDPIRLWGGYGDADLPSDAGTSTFKGIGDRGLIQSSSGAIGGTAQNTTLALSGIEAAALDVLEPDEVKEASVVVRRLIYDSAGKTLLGAYVYSRGRLDELKTSEVVGGAAAIQLAVEGAARGLGRRGGRLRSDADQRLVGSSDGFFKNVSFAAQKTLYWGGKKPATFG